ncbi:MAG TPA: dihydropteroate synthase [Sandaracinaceae bacterium LLY-WYZ-13_1]|nr:dihydropteroate synthase [Sandaracinaceae bacterium LLY-WYZ-13_1]
MNHRESIDMGGEPRRSDTATQPALAHESRRGRRTWSGAAVRERCAVWGVLNVTPDSFSDGGRHLALDDAWARADRMREEGADVIDVGGESSRPPGRTYGAGAAKVGADEELRRVLPVVERLVAAGAAVSVDTVKGEVARRVLAAGAGAINDVSMGADPALLEAVAAHGADLVLMHTRDGGRVDGRTTAYDDLVAEVRTELEGAVERAVARGVDRARIWIDPGIGFAKTPAQSAALLGNLDALVATGYPVLVGASRKSFIARTMAAAGAPEPSPDARLGGSLAAVTAAALAGCAAVRVHDVRDSVQAARVAEAMAKGRVA